MSGIPEIPLLRQGRPYLSLDKTEVCHHSSGEVLARLSLANQGLIRRDIIALEGAGHSAISCTEIVSMCKKAAKIFVEEELPFGDHHTQSYDEYIEILSAASGMPISMCHSNSEKVTAALSQLDLVLKGLTRNLDLALFDSGRCQGDGLNYSYFPTCLAFGVILPNNSPGVNTLWLPAVAMKVPLVLKPGSGEPFTPWRILQALMRAGIPEQLIGYYPAAHDGSAAISETCGRVMLFGDQKTVERYREDPRVSVHGPGYSKVLIGEDLIDEFEKHLDVIADSIALNSGRSCINASTLVVPRRGKEIAEKLAQRLSALVPRNMQDPQAGLSAFANPAMAEYIDESIDEGLNTPGARDCSATHREKPRLCELEGSVFLHPTIVYCKDREHPLAKREFLFPYAAVAECPQKEVVEYLGPTLALTAITRDPDLTRELLQAPHVDRLNIGGIPTPKIRYDQPHEGNLFELLFRRRAIQEARA